MVAILLDTRTQTVVQVIVSIMLGIIMTVAWRTQKTYPGFGRWTASKLPHALGWLLVGLRGITPIGRLFSWPTGSSSSRRFYCMKASANSAANHTIPGSTMR